LSEQTRERRTRDTAADDEDIGRNEISHLSSLIVQ
jgi:hypothetical protein